MTTYAFLTPHFIGSGNVGIPGDEPLDDFLISSDNFELQSSDDIFLTHD